MIGRNVILAPLALLIFSCAQQQSPSSSEFPSDAIVIAPNTTANVNITLSTIDDFKDIESVAKGDQEYKKFLERNWTEANKVVPARGNSQKISPQAGGSATCSVYLGSFSNYPINNTVSGTYDSTCVGTGDARVVYGNHTMTVKNTLSNLSNALTKQSATGSISMLGAPVRMSFGFVGYCVGGYIYVRDLLGISHSGTSAPVCSYYSY